MRQYQKICPECENIIVYKNSNSYYANRNRNSSCRKCKWKSHSEKLKGRKREPFSEEWKRNIADGHKKSDTWKASMNTPQYKEKHRQKMYKMMADGKANAAFNKSACNVFSFINSKMNWSGTFAANPKEKFVGKYYLDYYEPNLNLVIEWDEKHHNKTKQKKIDTEKQMYIIETLNCDFYRVDDETHNVKKINSVGVDKFTEIQSVINEYYEKENRKTGRKYTQARI